jgi:GNAT superfamily N-acetyltransferase
MAPSFRATDTGIAPIRPLRDDDALDVIELIAGVFGEYPGCVTDVDGEMPELRRLASYYAEHGGEGWIALRAGRVVGTVGFVMLPSGQAELKKLYVHRTERGTGLAGALVDRVEGAARARGARRVELWSDTRFERAHRFYERRGYARAGAIRDLHDKSDTREHFFGRALP